MIISCARWQAITCATRMRPARRCDCSQKPSLSIPTSLPPKHGRVVLRMVQDQRLDDRPRGGTCRNRALCLAAGGCALARCACAGYVVGEVEAARNFVDRAVLVNPNLAGAWWASGWIRVYLGESDTAIDHLTRAMRLSPLDPIGTGGRDPSERVVTIVGMRTSQSERCSRAR
jgi:hypothetical protein